MKPWIAAFVAGGTAIGSASLAAGFGEPIVSAAEQSGSEVELLNGEKDGTSTRYLQSPVAAGQLGQLLRETGGKPSLIIISAEIGGDEQVFGLATGSMADFTALAIEGRIREVIAKSHSALVRSAVPAMEVARVLVVGFEFPFDGNGGDDQNKELAARTVSPDQIAAGGRTQEDAIDALLAIALQRLAESDNVSSESRSEIEGKLEELAKTARINKDGAEFVHYVTALAEAEVREAAGLLRHTTSNAPIESWAPQAGDAFSSITPTGCPDIVSLNMFDGECHNLWMNFEWDNTHKAALDSLASPRAIEMEWKNDCGQYIGNIDIYSHRLDWWTNAPASTTPYRDVQASNTWHQNDAAIGFVNAQNFATGVSNHIWLETSELGSCNEGGIYGVRGGSGTGYISIQLSRWKSGAAETALCALHGNAPEWCLFSRDSSQLRNNHPYPSGALAWNNGK